MPGLRQWHQARRKSGAKNKPACKSRVKVLSPYLKRKDALQEKQ